MWYRRDSFRTSAADVLETDGFLIDEQGSMLDWDVADPSDALHPSNEPSAPTMETVATVIQLQSACCCAAVKGALARDLPTSLIVLLQCCTALLKRYQPT